MILRLEKMPDILQTTFSSAFLWKILYFGLDFFWDMFLFLCSNWQFSQQCWAPVYCQASNEPIGDQVHWVNLVTIGSGNGLVLNRNQTNVHTYIPHGATMGDANQFQIDLYCLQHQNNSFRNVKSSPPSAAYMRLWTGSALVQVMACRLFGAKPLPEPMLTYCQLEPWEQNLVKLESGYTTFYSWKCIWKHCLQTGCHFVRAKIATLLICCLTTNSHHWLKCFLISFYYSVDTKGTL